ncbi:MAG: A24 family peptidase [Planctomycetota bacterium]|nr:A24 family peptidase [Planctomycetota bacterium]
MLSVVFGTSAALMGACVGSFLNVVIHRVPQEDPKQRSLGGRSHCPHCGEQIAWRDNIPLLGWLLLRGRGRCCGQAIGVRYPLVELATALLFVALWLWPPHGAWLAPGTSELLSERLIAGLFDAAFLSFLLASSCIDWDHRILPDVLTKPFMGVGVAASLVVTGYLPPLDPTLTPMMNGLLSSLVGLGTGFGLTWLIQVGARAAFRKEAMGFGDVKFMGAIGAFLGWEGALLTFFLGSVVGAVGGLVHRFVTGDAYVPFGPFLAIGAVLTLFVREPILVFLFQTWPEWQRTDPMAPILVGVIALIGLLSLVFLVRRGRRGSQ